jgi:hypothetical protein
MRLPICQVLVIARLLHEFSGALTVGAEDRHRQRPVILSPSPAIGRGDLDDSGNGVVGAPSRRCFTVKQTERDRSPRSLTLRDGSQTAFTEPTPIRSELLEQTRQHYLATSCDGADRRCISTNRILGPLPVGTPSAIRNESQPRRILQNKSSQPIGPWLLPVFLVQPADASKAEPRFSRLH